jgi:hypothetical protein
MAPLACASPVRVPTEIHDGGSEITAGIVERFDPSVESGKCVLHQIFSSISISTQDVRQANHARVFGSIESDERITRITA